MSEVAVVMVLAVGQARYRRDEATVEAATIGLATVGHKR